MFATEIVDNDSTDLTGNCKAVQKPFDFEAGHVIGMLLVIDDEATYPIEEGFSICIL